jgi:hypothetical protein
VSPQGSLVIKTSGQETRSDLIGLSAHWAARIVQSVGLLTTL